MTEAIPGGLATFSIAGKTRYGYVKGDSVVDLSGRFGGQWPTLGHAVEAGALERLTDAAVAVPGDYAEAQIKYDIPLSAPGKIICVGVNYPDRNEEYKDGQAAPAYPSLFIRFPQSFVGHREPLICPPESSQLDYEGEVVIVIGKSGRRIAERDAFDHIAALSLCNEGTIRDWVRHAKFNVTQGKNFDATGAIGPYLVPFVREEQIADIELKTKVNGELRQQDRTSRMIFGFRRLIAYISTFASLHPGDVIVTGTPTGAGARLSPPRWLVAGDVVEIAADGIGKLRNTVAKEIAG
jgi:2-keto-4-pentenoate hydratase/2-oxohepta-3-ene-1,7-dioic acid hydratase in catechol pathway